MDFSGLMSAVENSHSGVGGKVLHLTHNIFERGEVIALFVQLLEDGECVDLKGDGIPDTWAGIERYVHLVHFLVKNKCAEHLSILCYQLGLLVSRCELGAVWGVLLGGVASDAALVCVSLENGAADDVWTGQEGGLATDGLTAAEGRALNKLDQADNSAKVLLGANRLDPGSWPRTMREAVDKDFFLSLCQAWTKLELDLHGLSGYYELSPTEVDSDAGAVSPTSSSVPSVRRPEEPKGSRRCLRFKGKRETLRSAFAALRNGASSLTRAKGDSRAGSSTNSTMAESSLGRKASDDSVRSVWGRYSEEFGLALGELRAAAPDTVDNAVSARERNRGIVGYRVITQTRINDLLG